MTRAEIIKKVKDRISRYRSQAEQTALNNRNIALSNTEYKALDRQANIDMIAIANNEDTLSHKQSLARCTEQMTKILSIMGLSSKDLKPQYHCPHCEDTGVYQDKYCKCFEQMVNEAFASENKSSIISDYTFAKSNGAKLSPTTRNIYEKLQGWCERFPNTKVKTLVFQGNTGTGKTYLASCICNSLTSRQYLVQSYTAFSFNNLMLKYHTTFDDTKPLIMDSVLDCDLLLIDDLGSESILKNVTIEYLFLIINERSLNGKATIITTNLSPEQILSRYGERVFSRLMNKSSAVLLNFDGKDLRVSK